MQKDNKLFEDVAKLASSAGGTVLEMKREMEAAMAARFENWVRKMNLPSKEELDLVREMAVKARIEQEKLAERVAELEQKLAQK